MRHVYRDFLLAIALVAAALTAAAQTLADFPLKDGDVWVMAGDSITAQHLHSNYFEAFCFARYPQLKFAFRNSGVGGHTIPSTLARFDYDIAAWKPTVVSVELGMNDQGGTPTEKFVANMGVLVERIRAINARPVIFSASPMNNGSTLSRLGRNQRLHEYAVALRTFTASEKLPYADQFHALLDIWGNNKPKELLANSLPVLHELAADDSLLGAEHLRAFLAAQETSPTRPVSMQGDAVHPGPPGQLMMATALEAARRRRLCQQRHARRPRHAPRAKGCEVDKIEAAEGKIAFDRLDQRLPLPVPDEARSFLPFYPVILELSQYTLRVTGLAKGAYTLKINGAVAAAVTAEQLEAGVNLTALDAPPQAKQINPIAAQGRAVLAAVAAKESLVSQWRGLSKARAESATAELEEKLTALGQEIERADARIREAARPQKLHFELAAAP